MLAGNVDLRYQEKKKEDIKWWSRVAQKGWKQDRLQSNFEIKSFFLYNRIESDTQ